MKEDLTKHS